MPIVLKSDKAIVRCLGRKSWNLENDENVEKTTGYKVHGHIAWRFSSFYILSYL